MRTRDLKPSFFKHPVLSRLDPLTRLMFQGLWVEADREGRLRDRPLYLKDQILPHDECDPDSLLNTLANTLDEDGEPFIYRYQADGKKYIEITKFRDNQSVHPNEKASQIPTRFENLDHHGGTQGSPRSHFIPSPLCPSSPSVPSRISGTSRINKSSSCAKTDEEDLKKLKALETATQQAVQKFSKHKNPKIRDSERTKIATVIPDLFLEARKSLPKTCTYDIAQAWGQTLQAAEKHGAKTWKWYEKTFYDKLEAFCPNLSQPRAPPEGCISLDFSKTVRQSHERHKVKHKP